MRTLLILLFFQSLLLAENSDINRLLICGVCRNVSASVDNTIHNIEELGSHFADYTAIIYENNSTDDTLNKLRAWAKANPRVVVLSETLSQKKLNKSRTVRIANARNKVLKEARKKKYNRYKYLVMADLDFRQPWPIQEIVESINHTFDWDSISANGITVSGIYYDRFAYRSRDYPLGPELLDYEFWKQLPLDSQGSWFSLAENSWPRVYSAFGGLAIYKTASITKCRYSGSVTKKLKRYYKSIFRSLAKDHPQSQLYNTLNPKAKLQDSPIFRKNCMEWQPADDRSVAVCEHVTLHAEMALKGHGIFYINPKMIMRY